MTRAPLILAFDWKAACARYVSYGSRLLSLAHRIWALSKACCEGAFQADDFTSIINDLPFGKIPRISGQPREKLEVIIAALPEVCLICPWVFCRQEKIPFRFSHWSIAFWVAASDTMGLAARLRLAKVRFSVCSIRSVMSTPKFSIMLFRFSGVMAKASRPYRPSAIRFQTSGYR